MIERYAKRCAAVLILAAGCSSSGSSTVRVNISGEEAALSGYPVGSGESQIAFVDGFTLQFRKILVSIADFELHGRDGDRAMLNADPIVADLHLGEPQAWEFDDVPSRRWDDVRFSYGPPTASSRLLEGVLATDVERMIMHGYAIVIQATASDGTQSYNLDLGFPLAVEASSCTNGTDETDGLVVPDNGIAKAQITIHLDHIFLDTFASDNAKMRFEPYAASAGSDHLITLDGLASQELADLRDRKGEPIKDGNNLVVYDPGSLMINERTLRDYVIGAATTTLHFNGEGHCDYRLLTSP